jgi:hypothetical protein
LEFGDHEVILFVVVGYPFKKTVNDGHFYQSVSRNSKENLSTSAYQSVGIVLAPVLCPITP